MNTYPVVLADSATMLGRTLRRMRRYPSLTLFIAGIPIVFLLLFVYVFGGTLGAALGDVVGGRAAYLTYVMPGILVLTVAGAAQGTAISVAIDMTAGIVARFRTMAVARASVFHLPSQGVSGDRRQSPPTRQSKQSCIDPSVESMVPGLSAGASWRQLS
jgi:ABC-2 type transport system permease protein